MGNAVGAINKKRRLSSLRPLEVGGGGAVKRKELVWATKRLKILGQGEDTNKP
jgi:hypothetical protein